MIDLAVELEVNLVNQISFVDLKKAFDSISHAFLEEALIEFVVNIK